MQMRREIEYCVPESQLCHLRRIVAVYPEVYPCGKN